MSAAHPRRATIVGFNALGHDTQDESVAAARSSVFHSLFGCGGLILSDDDLTPDLASLSLSKDGPGPSFSTRPQSQPSVAYTAINAST